MNSVSLKTSSPHSVSLAENKMQATSLVNFMRKL